MADTKQLRASTGLFHNLRDNADGTYAEEHSGQMRAWDATSLAWVKVLVDHASGALSTTGGGGAAGGGAVTMADGANVTQGTTTDLASASTLVGILKAIKAAVQGTLAVSGTFWQATQPVSGTFWQATQPVSLATAPSTPVTGTFWQATQPVSGTFFQATQPVSLATNTPDVIDRAARLVGVVSGAANVFHIDDNSGSVTVDAPVGTPVFARLSDGAAALVGSKVSASSLPVVIASDQAAIPTTKVAATGQANVLKTGSLVTTAVTADQVVLTYTVTAAKTFYLCYLVMYGRLTAVSATASILGAISLETPSGTKAVTLDDVNPTTSEVEFNPIVFAEPIPIAAGVVVRVVVTPNATTSMTWRANFGGYEK